MDKAQLLHHVAPCSLLCYTCMAFKDGAVADCSRRLYAYNEGVGEFRGAFLPQDERAQWHAFFNEFRATLKHFSGVSCPGCRNNPSGGNDCIAGCVIPPCVQEHGVDFCAQCPDFPCQKARDFFDAHDEKISPVWEKGSMRIKEIGIDAYYEEKKDVSHYLHYAKEAE